MPGPRSRFAKRALGDAATVGPPRDGQPRREEREQPNAFDADIARMRSRFQNGTGPGF